MRPQTESADNPQIVVDFLKQPLAVMPLQRNDFFDPDTRENYPPSLMRCLLAYLGRGLRQEPFPDLQSFVDWAKTHPELELDLESPPEPRMSD